LTESIHTNKDTRAAAGSRLVVEFLAERLTSWQCAAQ